MGRAIDQDNRLDDHERRIKLMEDALEEMIQTRVHHVDLHKDPMDKHEQKIREENGVVVESDEKFTPPTTGKRSKKKTATVG